MRHARRGAWLAALCFVAAGVAYAAPDGRPRAIEYLGSLGDHDPEGPAPGQEPWTPADVVDLLAARPRASIALGRDEGPPSGPATRERRDELARIRARAAASGVAVDGRMCVPLRADVARKLRPGHARCAGSGCDWEGDMDGSHGEREAVVKARGQASGAGGGTLVDAGARWQPNAWAHRLLVLRPGTALEERRRILRNDGATLHVEPVWETPPRAGDAYEIRGSFDPAWVMRVPAGAHAESVRTLWSERRAVCGRSGRTPCAPPAEPLDPLAAGNQRGWRADLDRDAIAALATGGEVPALFGTNRDAAREVAYLTDPYPSVDAVVVDLREPGYRAWRARSLLYALEDHGVEPGTPACVIVGYEPAALAHYDAAAEGPSRHRCALPDTTSWQPPLHVCSEAAQAGGPLAPTPYGPGEYEAGLGELVRELLATLREHGYEDVRLLTAEGDALRGRPWTALAADLRFDARLEGELDVARAPRLADVAGAAAALAARADDSGGGGGAAGKGAGLAPLRGLQVERPAGGKGAPKTQTPRTPITGESGEGSRTGANGGKSKSAKAKAPKIAKAKTAKGSGGPASSWTIGSGGSSKSSTSKPSAPPRQSPPTSGGGAGNDGSFRPVTTASPETPAPARPEIGVEPPRPAPAPTGPAVSPPPSSGGGPDHPNEPAGMSARQPMNPMHELPPTNPAPPDRYGFKCWENQCRTLSIVNDPTSPGTDSDVLRVLYPRGSPEGHPPSRFLAGNGFGGKRRLYTSVYYKLSPNWTGNAKFFFFRARKDGVQNHFLAGPTWDPPYRTGFSLQVESGNRNIMGGVMPVGRWVHLEMLVEMNTPGRPDGVAKLWMDGDPVVSASDVLWVPALRDGRSLADVSWDYLWVDPTWGGVSGGAPEDMYFQVDDWYTSVGD